MAEEKKEKSKKEIAKEVTKTLVELEQTTKMEHVVKDNKIPFQVKEVNYRLRRPTPAEQMEVENFRRKKYLEYVNDDSYLFRKQWIEKYNKKGISIAKMETEMLTLQAEIENLQIRLAQVTNPVNITTLKNEILELKGKQQEVNVEKTDLLSCSIEDQLVVAVNSYYTYVVLEKEAPLGELDSEGNKKWVKVFDNYQTFMNCKVSELLNKAFYFINYIIYGESLSE